MPRTKPDDGLVYATHPEVCRLLGLPRKKVYDRAARGLIPHIRSGRRVQFSLAVLREWIREESLRNCRTHAKEETEK
jgi:excisionase family DNA binding protein